MIFVSSSLQNSFGNMQHAILNMKLTGICFDLFGDKLKTRGQPESVKKSAKPLRPRAYTSFPRLPPP